MHIHRLSIRNYKCFHRTGPMEFTPGINIITGQNNAGKTALLEVLTLSFPSKPHRSLITAPTPTALVEPTSSAQFTIRITGAELREMMLRPGPRPQINIPLPPKGSHHLPEHSAASVVDFCNWLTDQQVLDVTVGAASLAGQWSPTMFTVPNDPAFGLYEVDRDQQDNRRFAILTPSGNDLHAVLGNLLPPNSDLAVERLIPEVRKVIYYFRAQRQIPGTSGPGANSILAPDLTNLAQVLNTMQSNIGRFEEFNANVTTVFPQVKWISVRPMSGGLAEIMIWSLDRKSKRDDLAQPMSECGAGLGQAIAMLYVALNSPMPRTILIDEPSTFLHPGAIRALLEVFEQHPEHQYIISTHSPTVITASGPRTVLLLRASESENTIQQLDVTKAAEAQMYLEEIGASLADVFGATAIIWVEGATEERCFPEILRVIVGHSLMGIVIEGVINTGDLTSRDRKRVIEVYTRLSGGGSLLPPAIGYIFDSETRSESEGEKQALVKLSRDRLRFLRRRMFENYLLHPKAIASVLNTLDATRSAPVVEERIRELFQSAMSSEEYFKPFAAGAVAQGINQINGALFLQRTFATVTEARVQFDKVQHAAAICTWLLENEPSCLTEVAELIKERLDQVPS